MQKIDDLLKKVKRVHMIGIGGSGMSPLAEILHHEGYVLSGSDNNEGDNVNQMRSLGIPVYLGHKAENIQGAEVIVHTSALLPDNPEIIAAKEQGIPIYNRAELFGAISRLYKDTIAVSGTHGKTTVTSMLTQIYLQSDADPSAVIGGVLPLIGSHARVGNSATLLAEACEFRDAYLELSPNTVIILNVDEDHLDYFHNLENIIKSFQTFANSASSTIIYNGDDENTKKVIEGVTDKKLISFGQNAFNDFWCKDITMTNGAFASFIVMHKNNVLGELQLSVPGEHNIMNALASVASAYHSGLPMEKVLPSLAEFTGAGRRFEKLGTFHGVTVADDYAHHPKELKVTLEAVMNMDYKTVWAVFQPFTYSRTYLLFDDFVDVLQIPDRAVITKIMGSREINTYDIHAEDLAEKVPDSVCVQTFEEVTDYIVSHAKEGDLVITLGCGDVYKAARMIAERYKEMD